MWQRSTRNFLFFLGVLGPALLQANPDQTLIRHRGFETFSQGTFPDGGVNIYVSRAGRIQLIPRWDINRDGYMDILFNQDHNPVENVDAMIYWGGPRGYHSLFPPFWREVLPSFKLYKELKKRQNSVSFLPTFGGGPVDVADLNKDGYPDIVFVNTIHNYTVHMPAYIYWGSRDGYSEHKRTELPTLFGRDQAVADLNQDGWLDLVFANYGVESGDRWGYKHHLESYIYWGGPDGFLEERRTTIPTVSPVSCAAGDFNGDGWTDLAFANNNLQKQSVYVYFGGEGGFDEDRRLVKTGGNPLLVRAGDVNRDGADELLVVSPEVREAFFDADKTDVVRLETETKETQIYFGKARFDLDNPSFLPTRGAKEVAIEDLNGDGHRDLVFASSVPGRESGATMSEIYWGSASGFRSESPTLLPTLNAKGVTIGDLNRDGHPDIIFANSGNGRTYDVPSYIYWGTAKGFDPSYRQHLQGFGAVAVKVADLDGNEAEDIVLMNQLSGSGPGEIPSIIFWGNSAHHYSEAATTFLKAPPKPYFSNIADFNDDGFPDIVFSGISPLLYYGSEEGFKDPISFEFDFRTSGIVVADFNQNGWLDIIFNVWFGDPRKDVFAVTFWGSEDGFSLDRSEKITLKANRSGAKPATADLNRDGYLDMVFPAGESPHQMSEIMWGGPNGFGTKESTMLKTNWVQGPDIADLDGNGWLDLIFPSDMDANTQAKHTKSLILWGDENGFSEERRTELDSLGSLAIRIADLNRDGFLDLVTSNYKVEHTRSLPIFVYWGNAEHSYGNHLRTELPAESSCGIQVLDLNQDDYREIIVYNHIKDGDHNFGSYIYWGGSEGYSIERRTHLPTSATHYAHGISPGNIYDRRPGHAYVSPAVQVPGGKTTVQLDWQASTPHRTGIRFDIRSAPDRTQLEKAQWQPVESGEPNSLVEGARFLQYRATLISEDGGNSPVLEEVSLRLD